VANPDNRLRITYIITDLDVGGAEMGLFRLLASLGRDQIAAEVICLSRQGPVAERIYNLGVQVRSLGLIPARPAPHLMFKLAGWIKEGRPDLVHTWMYHADLIGSLAAARAGKPPVIWSIRNSTLDVQHSKRPTRWIVRLLASLSKRVPAAIVSVSEAAARVHIQKGYDAGKISVIPNGFDLEVFRPDSQARTSVRQELQLDANTRLVGLLARYDPQKDHANFLRAAAQVQRRFPDVHFLLAGQGVEPANAELMQQVQACGLTGRAHLLGRRDDIPRLTAALDVAVTASAYGEAFPQVIGEAMACGVPCAVTDVGDSAKIVAGSGRVAPPNDADALAGAIDDLLALPDAEMQTARQQARQKIGQFYSIESVARQYMELYRRTVTGQ
jgi:glycosyltransferase involved in cell wall biosynthesis